MNHPTTRVNADVQTLVVVASPMLASVFAGIEQNAYKVALLVCLAITSLLAFVEFVQVRNRKLGFNPFQPFLWLLVIVGCLLVISSLWAAWISGRVPWRAPLSSLALILAQSLSVIVYVTAKSRREPGTLAFLDRAIHLVSILVCASVVLTRLGYAFGWKFGEVQHSSIGLRSFGPLGDSVAWLVVLFLARWWQRGDKGWAVLGGAALALTVSMGPLLTSGLGIGVLLVLDTWRCPLSGLRRTWKKRGIVALWAGLGMVIASVPLPKLGSRSPTSQGTQPGEDSGLAALSSRFAVTHLNNPVSNVWWTFDERRANLLISLELLKRHWLIGAGYGATTWRFQEVPWRTHLPAGIISLYERGLRHPYAINVWLQLAVSGGLVTFCAALWGWIHLLVTMHRRLCTPVGHSGCAAEWSFMWILLAGCMLTADWLLHPNPVLHLVSIALAVSFVQNRVMEGLESPTPSSEFRARRGSPVETGNDS